MKTAKDIMTTEVLTFTPEMDVVAAAKILIERKINGAPVVQNPVNMTLAGILTQSDLVAQQKSPSMPSMFALLDGFIPLSSTDKLEGELRKISAATVGDAMTTKVVSVTEDTPVEKMASIMVTKKLHTLPVVDGDRLIGVVGKEDILKTMLEGDQG